MNAIGEKKSWYLMNTAPEPMLSEVAPLTESKASVSDKWLGRVEGEEKSARDK